MWFINLLIVKYLSYIYYIFQYYLQDLILKSIWFIIDIIDKIIEV